MVHAPTRSRPSVHAWVTGALLAGLSVGAAAPSKEVPAARVVSPIPQSARSCEDAERCFREAVASLGPRNNDGGVREEDSTAKVDQLRAVMEQHPGSLWAKRAGLVSGVLLRERDPGRAIQLLRAAKRDFPVLEDYVRFWTGQALLTMGDTAEGAALLQSIPEVVPDSLIGLRATYEAAEGWYRAGQCDRAAELFPKAFRTEDKETVLPIGYLHLAECQTQLKRPAEAQETLRRLWVRYPQSPEAREAYGRLSVAGGEAWKPAADDRLQRAKELHAQALHEEAVEEFRQFLSMANGHQQVADAKQKLGLSLVRLKRYDHAKAIFQEVIGNHAAEAGEAAVWLARVLLRQSEGNQLLALTQAPPKVRVTREQQAMLYILRGVWLEDQGQIEGAVAAYQKALDLGESTQHHSEALWKIGWAWYRAGKWKDAVVALERLSTSNDRDPLVAQALYWMARASERLRDPGAPALYQKVCQRYPVTYYCQLARQRNPALLANLSITETDAVLPGPESLPADKREEVTRDPAYRRAVELRLLGMDRDAARELTDLTQRHSREPAVVLALSRLLSEAGAHGQALRLARLHFRDDLEQRGTLVSPALWTVGYPTVFVPTIAAQGMKGVDPYLAAAVIREESQYDGRAVSRVGAIGLMQVMPATATTVAKKFGLADVKRDDLFDEGTNVRIGVRYLEQLLEQFQGNIVYAVASYNAGPQAVASWVAKNGQRETDEFVELIPYQETRLYVKRVVRSYREYLRLRNGTGDSARVFLDRP